MCSNFQGLNIIDLISEKHAKLRKMVIEAWVESGEERVSDTESYMLALIEKNELTATKRTPRTSPMRTILTSNTSMRTTRSHTGSQRQWTQNSPSTSASCLTTTSHSLM